ncbi:MAG: hypothetical protein ACF8PN_08000 [Phycisphaerales bacterium]
MTSTPRAAFTVDVSTENAAFTTDGLAELARILRTIADTLEHGGTWSHGDTVNVRDHNGNTVGAWRLAVDAFDSDAQPC